MTNEDKEILVRIDRYIRGELREDEKERLWRDFLRKPEYYHWFETELHLRHMRETDGKSDGSHPESGHHQNDMPGGRVLNGNGSPVLSLMSRLGSYRWAIAAAAILMMVVGMNFFGFHSGSDLQELAVSRIDVTELSGAGIMRSDDQETDRDQAVLSRGIASAYNGNEAEAAEQFAIIINRTENPEMLSRAELNMGIVQYNRQNFEEASAHFIQSLQNTELSEFLEEKTRWFLANSYLMTGTEKDAIAELDTILRIKGRYETDASDLKQKLGEAER